MPDNRADMPVVLDHVIPSHSPPAWLPDCERTGNGWSRELVSSFPNAPSKYCEGDRCLLACNVRRRELPKKHRSTANWSWLMERLAGPKLRLWSHPPSDAFELEWSAGHTLEISASHSLHGRTCGHLSLTWARPSGRGLSHTDYPECRTADTPNVSVWLMHEL